MGFLADIALALELLVVGAGLFFLHLAGKESSKYLKLGAYILLIGGIVGILMTGFSTLRFKSGHGNLPPMPGGMKMQGGMMQGMPGGMPGGAMPDGAMPGMHGGQPGKLVPLAPPPAKNKKR